MVERLYLLSQEGCFADLGFSLVMSASIDRVMMEMSLEEKDVPFDMPDLPEFCSSEKNICSLVGRTLNPDCQQMSSLVRDMPRKWQLYHRVRGVALTQEKFQFIFQHEHDLERILEKGVHTFNEWAIVIDRWVENPPEDYLKFMPIWVQIRNIPVNHYTTQAITALGEIVGQVMEVAFDPLQPQVNDFVRVRVKFDVSNPLRRSKVVNFKGGPVTIFFDFERVQKRCFTCQRLTHEQGKCPVKLKEDQEKVLAKKQKKVKDTVVPNILIPESDPLFGVLREDQVGIDPTTGRLRMAKDVVDEMRKYIRGAEGADRAIKIDKIKSSLEALKNDLLGAKSILRLEPPPLVFADVNKGKGLVFGYSSDPPPKEVNGQDKLYLKGKGAIFQAGRVMDTAGNRLNSQSDVEKSSIYGSSLLFQNVSTAFNAGLSGADYFGNILKKSTHRRRPYRARRKAVVVSSETDSKEEDLEVLSKRKAADEAVSTSKVAKRKTNEVAPNEGLSRH